jgi:hypothetical protein
MKKLIIVVSILVFVGLVVLFVAGYFLGNVPVVSKLLGSNKPVDLGVTISTDNAYRGLKELNIPTHAGDLQAVVQNPSSFKTIKASLTQEEVSSLLALGDIPDFPLKLTQVRFNPDGSMESSGVLDIDLLKTFLEKNGLTASQIETVNNYLKLKGKVNYYAKGRFSITNNRVSLDLEQIKAGNINIPNKVFQDNTATVENFVSNSLTANNIYVRNMSLSGGRLQLDVDRPISNLNPWLKFVGN